MTPTSNSNSYKFVNLTPHKITVLDGNNNVVLEIPPSGIARVDSKPEKVGEINGIPVNKVKYGHIYIGDDVIEDNVDWMYYVSKNVEPGKRTVFIVSLLVLQAMKQKGINTEGESFIVVSPDTNPYSAIRDKNGRIIGVKAFQII